MLGGLKGTVINSGDVDGVINNLTLSIIKGGACNASRRGKGHKSLQRGLKTSCLSSSTLRWWLKSQAERENLSMRKHLTLGSNRGEGKIMKSIYNRADIKYYIYWIHVIRRVNTIPNTNPVFLSRQIQLYFPYYIWIHFQRGRVTTTNSVYSGS